MKRFLTISVFLIVFLFPTHTFAENLTDSDYNSLIESYSVESIFESLDNDTKRLLEELGVDEFDYDNLVNLTPKKIVKIFKEIVSKKASYPLASLAEIVILVMLSSLFNSMKSTIENDSMSDIYSLSSAVTIALILTVKMNNVITLSCASLGICANFVLAFVPVFAVIVASSGGITTSFSTNALILGLAQLLNIISDKFFLPLINCFLCIGVSAGIRPQLNLSKVTSTMKKYITSAISVCSAGFVSILSLKTAVASKVDAIGLRSVRFAINSIIPVIGSAISEGLLSIQSYSDLIKSSVGVTGIIIVFLVFLPSLVELTIWKIAISLCLICSDLFNDQPVKAVLSAFSDTLMLILVLLILSMVTTVISVGVLIAARSGV